MSTQCGELTDVDIDALWDDWEKSAINNGFDHEQTQLLAQQIKSIEGPSAPQHRQPPEVYGDTTMAKAHKLFDRLRNKRKPQDTC